MTSQKRLRLLVFFLLTVVGVVLLAWGVDEKNIGVYAIFSGMGAAILGASIPSIIAIYLSDEFGALKDYLLSKNGFTSDPDEAEACEGKWYLYHTSKKGGVKRWLCEILDFKLDEEIGTLKCTSILNPENGTIKRYIIDGGVRSDRLVLIERPEKGKEPHAITIIYGGATEHHSIRCGIMLHQTWDGSTAFSPCMLTRHELKDIGHDIESVGSSSFFDISQNTKFETIWKDEVSSQKLDIFIG